MVHELVSAVICPLVHVMLLAIAENTFKTRACPTLRSDELRFESKFDQRPAKFSVIILFLFICSNNIVFWGITMKFDYTFINTNVSQKMALIR